MIALDDDKPFDVDASGHQPFLGNLQGNILKGHGRNVTANVFLSFRVEGDALRAVLRDLANRYVTSARAQLQQSRDYRAFGLPGPVFGNLFLTANTYRKLGLAAAATRWFAEAGAPGRPAPRQWFLEGMHDARSALGDQPASPPRDALEGAYVGQTIDALLLLADDAEDHVLREARAAIDWLVEHDWAAVLAVEVGRALRNDDEEGIEHFGYVDGRSQPLFLRSDFTGLEADGTLGASAREKTNDKRVSRETGRIDAWNPFAPLSLALVADPGTAAADAFGSFYVFRKLEQDVLHFCMAEQALADALGLQGSDRPRAGAMVVGRFRDGTPLALNETDGFVPAKANNFRYDGLDAALQPQAGAQSDAYALKCPFQSHIRRVNPRQIVDQTQTAGDQAREDAERRMRRIVRRGITYGERRRTPTTLPALDDLPTGGVGLLFACFQASIDRQFAFIQQRWVQSIHFPMLGGSSFPGQDSLLGPAPAPDWPQRWRAEYGGALGHPPTDVLGMDMSRTHPTQHGFGGFVTFRGGEFFFAPSLPFLRNEQPRDDT